MTRQQAKELLPILQAFAEGKEVELKTKEGSEWSILEEDDMQYIDFLKCDLRIKPKYRPFANKEECWQEMLKHQPFGWVKAYHGQFVITEIRDSKATIGRNDRLLDFDYIFKNYKFADGTPFGIKEEE